MNKLVKTIELFDATTPYLKPLFESSEFPWEILPKIKEHVFYVLENFKENFTEIQKGVYVGKNVKIAKTATFEGINIIGDNSEIRPGAYFRGNVITGENCVIGNSTELKNSVLLNGVQVPHYNYVGDSILGNYAHMGAGSICSNLKSDKKNIVIHGEKEYQTGLRKIGGILGDYADVGCNSVINPGTIIGKKTAVYPLTFLRGVYPADCIVKSTNEVVERK
jgi:NDP-sugar pyrophosphorylase family protein